MTNAKTRPPRVLFSDKSSLLIPVPPVIAFLQTSYSNLHQDKSFFKSIVSKNNANGKINDSSRIFMNPFDGFVCLYLCFKQLFAAIFNQEAIV